MTAVSHRLDAIQARLDRAAPGAITITPSDVAWLRDTARKQQAALDAVTAIVEEWEARDNPTIDTYIVREALEATP